MTDYPVELQNDDLTKGYFAMCIGCHSDLALMGEWPEGHRITCPKCGKRMWVEFEEWAEDQSGFTTLPVNITDAARAEPSADP